MVTCKLARFRRLQRCLLDRIDEYDTPEFRALDREVADAFEVPLAFLMDPANHRRHALDIGGVRREWFSMPYTDARKERFVWGATAAMLRNFYRLLAA